MGQAPPSADCNVAGSGVPFVKAGEFGDVRPFIREWTTRPLRLAKRTDVLICVVGATCGKLNLGEDCAIGRSVAAVRPDPEKLDQRYLHYFLMTLVSQLRADSVGAAQTVISKEMIEAIHFPWRVVSEQRRIVAILDEAFEGIATAKANAEKNLQNARELFESRLGHLFSDLKEDGPKTRIADICDIKHGYAFDGAHFSGNDDGQAPILLTPGNFAENGRLQFSERNTKRYTNTDIPRGFVLEDGDLVVVMTDLSSTMKILGKPAIVDRPQLLHNQRIGRVVSLQAGVATRYVYYFMRTAGYVRGIKRTATGTMVKHTAPTRILDAVLPLPPIERQAEIIDALDEAEEQVQMLETNYQRRSAALDELKKSLLHQAFNGAL